MDFSAGLERAAANFAPLTPLSFLYRAEAVWPERTAWIHGETRANYRAFGERCRRLASALAARGVGPGDTVAVMAPNTPCLLEAHYGAAMAGAVLCALNTRLDAATVRHILRHGEARALIVDREFAPVAAAALEGLAPAPFVVDSDDPAWRGPGARIGAIEYEALLAAGDPAFAPRPVADEWDAISLNYTSGTTGDPKGVVYHHRGAWLNAVGNHLAWGMAPHPVYLWTLPMFHCNGWCFPWTVAALGGTQVCLRRVEARAIYAAIARRGVTHLCGAPIVLNLIANAPEAERAPFSHTVRVMTAAAPPPPTTIAAIERAGFDVTHVYGLTECYGPGVVCAWREEWDALPPAERAALKARQGVRYPVLESLETIDPETGAPVPADGETLGEVTMCGNIVMKGYLKDREATAAAFAGGRLRTGDLGVVHPDGYLELRDRAKDIIISGGENISSIEVERALYRHPAVLEAAVVARPDEKWGETPCAFVELRAGAGPVDAEALIAFCRARMARFKAPRAVVFGPLPKTSTGKVRKTELRARARVLPPR